jgi:hypothetical protein
MDGPLPLHPQGSTPIALGAVAVGVRDVAEGAWPTGGAPFCSGTKRAGQPKERKNMEKWVVNLGSSKFMFSFEMF